MGLTLTAASVAGFYSLDFSCANYEQSRARIHRIWRTQKCLYIHLVAKGTVDEKVMWQA
jgi:SNF2 family DNA or RNA helicase